MKVWITKYALTRGIYEAEVEENKWRTSPGWVAITVGHFQSFGPGDWSTTEEGAKAQAQKKRCQKIGSLKRQIHKLSQLDI